MFWLAPLAEILLPAAFLAIVGLYRPDWFDWLGSLGLNNPFRNEKLRNINLSWLVPVVYIALMCVLDFRFTSIAVIGFGGLLVFMTYVSDWLDWLGALNFAKWKWTYQTGIVTAGAGVIILLLKPVWWMFDIGLAIMLAFYLWKYQREFVQMVFGLFRSNKNMTKSA